MTLIELGILLIIAAICGAIGQALAGYSHGGCLGSMAVGFVGGLLGAWFVRITGLPTLYVVQIDEVDFPIVWSILGSALLVALLSWLVRPRVARVPPE